MVKFKFKIGSWHLTIEAESEGKAVEIYKKFCKNKENILEVKNVKIEKK